MKVDNVAAISLRVIISLIFFGSKIVGSKTGDSVDSVR